MDTNLALETKNMLATLESKFKNDPMINEFEKASSEFKSLVEKGFVKERGYNLMTIEDAHLHKVGFNTGF